ncbi:Type III restriction enzyme, res subunit family [Tepidicaulis marinus]|uniref:Type III restriction enzyme, res subunit family n=1 Tax=Tepidicaulis marinus TaxID=1333998 RepID=A0A081BFG5_9HYPH|nr:DEAD/DEAH box helicase family protein [Tepidicaulis marinus]GAK46783.1 Type III restriction enzyme, res subunit family [Tepidicaulis marinus]
MMPLRPWQEQALSKALHWLVEQQQDKHFLINAAPGSGKTIAACTIAERLIEMGEIDRVVVIAPRVEVVRQWAADFYTITNRFMGRITGSAADEIETDVCVTWSAVQSLQDAFQAVCRSSRVLVICDEHHHAAVQAAWGTGADNSFVDAKYVLVLTGTPIRSDGKRSIWVAYDDNGAINHPEEGTYTLSYGEAVDLGYCRPATFHRHDGYFTVDLEDGETIAVSGKEPARLTPTLKRIAGLQRALEFYKLACTPQFETDNRTPRVDGYQGTMVQWASSKLDDLRYRMPDAGGLVIAPNIDMAEYMVDLIEQIEGEKPSIVHSQLPNADNRIESFRHTDRRWIVSVAMISEGVDISRLRVLVYLPNALTELAFRQAIGRVVRSSGPDDDTRAYVVMPSFDVLEAFARRVEDEMSPDARKDTGPAKSKKCPACTSEMEIGERFCEACGYEFPETRPRFKSCDTCQGLNIMAAKTCQHCGSSFAAVFTLSLDEALRTGAIIRGMDIDEGEVQEAEAFAGSFRRQVMASGDENLVKIIKQLPEESWARLRRLMNDEG